jgi:hypothetical protein
MDSYFVATCLGTIVGNWDRLSSALSTVLELETIEYHTEQSRISSDSSWREQRQLGLKTVFVKPM